ncbi:MAG: hypothetical protein ACRDJX_02195 [Solirubrobacteraceae bacterium]
MAGFARRRLTYANVTATLALFFSISGGALAAEHYLVNSTAQINPKVLRQLRGARGRQGLAGVAGSTGATGPSGPAGATGPAGPAGPRGGEGATGATGPEGKTGAKGERGQQGEEGKEGKEGPEGPGKGEKGEKGETGATGATGPEGKQGAQGAKGQAGAEGKEGPEGPEGASDGEPAALKRWRKTIQEPGSSEGHAHTVTLAEVPPFTITGHCYEEEGETVAQTYISSSQEDSYLRIYEEDEYESLGEEAQELVWAEARAEPTEPDFEGGPEGGFSASAANGLVALDGTADEGVWLEGEAGQACSFSGELTSE